MAAATSLYGSLGKEGIAILLDDCDESASSRLADGDLLGMPLPVTVGRRPMQQGVAEVKRGDQPRKTAQLIPLDRVPAWVFETIAAMGGKDG